MDPSCRKNKILVAKFSGKQCSISSTEHYKFSALWATIYTASLTQVQITENFGISTLYWQNSAAAAKKQMTDFVPEK